MEISKLFTQIRIWFDHIFSNNNSRAKIPRKKLQIQFDHAKQQFDSQVKALENALTTTELSGSVLLLGEQLRQEIHRFEELHLIQINQNRLDTIPQPLIHPIDFSLWIIYQMYSFTEEIFHFLKTMEEVEI